MICTPVSLPLGINELFTISAILSQVSLIWCWGSCRNQVPTPHNQFPNTFNWIMKGKAPIPFLLFLYCARSTLPKIGPSCPLLAYFSLYLSSQPTLEWWGGESLYRKVIFDAPDFPLRGNTSPFCISPGAIVFTRIPDSQHPKAPRWYHFFDGNVVSPPTNKRPYTTKES